VAQGPLEQYPLLWMSVHVILVGSCDFDEILDRCVLRLYCPPKALRLGLLPGLEPGEDGADAAVVVGGGL
jgi:hypothetical protein